jgi:hypothetical protein
MNVRLYNPYPADRNATKHYIIGPLCALLMFVLPRSEDGQSFTWPFCCFFRFPGAVQQTSGFITNVTVAKGGDDNIWAMNQRPGMVDVKVDFGTLYNVLINGIDDGRISLPTIHEYAKELEATKGINPDEWTKKEKTVATETTPAPINKTFPPGGRTEPNREEPDTRLDDNTITAKELLDAAKGIFG